MVVVVEPGTPAERPVSLGAGSEPGREKLGEYLRWVRTEVLGATQASIASRAGCTQAWVSATERGVFRLGLNSMQALAEAYGVQLQTLLLLAGRVEPEPPEPARPELDDLFENLVMHEYIRPDARLTADELEYIPPAVRRMWLRWAHGLIEHVRPLCHEDPLPEVDADLTKMFGGSVEPERGDVHATPAAVEE